MRRLALFSLMGVSLGAAILATLAFDLADYALARWEEET
jgi:hypothetical protein